LAAIFVGTALTIQAAAPTAIAVNPYVLQENCAPGTVVGTLTATDPDVGDSHTFQLVTGAGDSDNPGFIISGNQLIAPYGVSIEGLNVDYEVDPRTFSIRVKTKDAALNSFEQVVVIQMTDDRNEDADGDGLTEAQEEDNYGTSDLLYDTDLDGVGDGGEVAGGTPAFNANIWPGNALLGWGDNQLRQLSGLIDPEILSITTGQFHGLALRTNGTVAAWGGRSLYGQTTVPAGLADVVGVAAGGDYWLEDSGFSLALKRDGTVVSWGCNIEGQTTLPPGLNGVVAIAAGRVHSLALKSDGTVVAWGLNNFGQTSVPAGLSDVIAISAGGFQSMALKSDGTVVAWGSTFNGQYWEPVTVPGGLSDVVAISAGRFHSLALKGDGKVVAWGYNENGQAGVPTNLTGVVAVAAGGFHSLALKSDGSVVSWGLNSIGQSLIPPAAAAQVKTISAGMLHSLALRRVSGFPEITSSPNVFAEPGAMVSHAVLVSNAVPTQFSASGLPQGLSINSLTGLITGEVVAPVRKPVRVRVETDRGTLTQILWVRIFLGSAPTDMTLSSASVLENSLNGTVVGTLTANDPDQGDTQTFELVSGTGSADNAYFRISGNQLLVNQNLGRDFELNPSAFSIRVRSRDASLNSFEKSFAITFLDDRSEDVDGDGLTEAQEEDLYGTSDLAYDTDDDGFGDGYEVRHGSSPVAANNFPSGTLLVAWGKNNRGQATEPAGLGDVIDLAAGLEHSLALRTDGTVIAWGRGDEGQTVVPAGLSSVVAVEAGDYHSLALKSDSTVVAWGGNNDGQTTVPPGLSDVIAIAAGNYHNLALKRDGTVVAWGYNEYGQTTVPAGLANVVAIAAGGFHSVALKSDGTVVAWGSDFGGAVSVPAGLGRVVAISAGAYHTLALKSDGTVAQWGDSTNGQGFLPQNLTEVSEVAAGWVHSTVVKRDGTAEAWGSNSFGQGNLPFEAAYLKRLIAGDYHNLALRRSTGFPEITNHAPVAAWPGDVISYQINVAGAVPSHFEAMGLPGDLTLNSSTGLITGTVVNGARRSVRIIADTNKGRMTRVIWINTIDGKPPTDLALAASPVVENSPTGTVVGSLSATDPDVGDTFTYQLLSDGTARDNRYFDISGNQLRVRSGFNRDFETDPSALSIRIMVIDSAQNTFEKSFSIPFLDDRLEDADGDGFSEAVEEDILRTSDSVFGDYAHTDGDRDGIPPLIEYAFNLSTTVPDGNINLGGAGSTSGLPVTNLVADGLGHQLLRIQYLRRIGSGLTYTPQFGSGLSAASWQSATQTVQITPVNAQWERCQVDDSQTTSGAAKRFARVAVKP